MRVPRPFRAIQGYSGAGSFQCLIGSAGEVARETALGKGIHHRLTKESWQEAPEQPGHRADDAESQLVTPVPADAVSLGTARGIGYAILAA